MNKFYRQNLNLNHINPFYQRNICFVEKDDPAPTETINDDPPPTETISDDPPTETVNNDPKPDNEPKKTLADHVKDGGLPAGIDWTSTEKPEGLKDDYWNADENTFNFEAIVKFANDETKRANGLRKQVADKGNEDKNTGKAPESVEGYKLEFSDKVQEHLAEDTSFIDAFKEEALALGVSAEAWDTVTPALFSAYEKHMIGEELTPEQKEAQEQEHFDTEAAKLGTNGPALIKKAETFNASLKARGIVPESDADEWDARFMTSAVGIRALNRIEDMVSGSAGIPTNVEQQGDGLPPDSEILAVMSSDKYRNEDPETVKKVRGWMEARKKSGRPAQMQV